MDERTGDLLVAAMAVIEAWDAYIEGQPEPTEPNRAQTQVGLKINRLDNAVHEFPPGFRGGAR